MEIFLAVINLGLSISVWLGVTITPSYNESYCVEES